MSVQEWSSSSLSLASSSSSSLSSSLLLLSSSSLSRGQQRILASPFHFSGLQTRQRFTVIQPQHDVDQAVWYTYNQDGDCWSDCNRLSRYDWRCRYSSLSVRRSLSTVNQKDYINRRGCGRFDLADDVDDYALSPPPPTSCYDLGTYARPPPPPPAPPARTYDYTTSTQVDTQR